MMVRCQVDNGSATTTVQELALGEDCQKYPDARRPMLTSARNRRIQSQGHGYLKVATLEGTNEVVHSKVTSAIKHLIVSPAQHLERNFEKYRGYTIGVDARDGTSVLMFKSNEHQPLVNKFDTKHSDCVIKRTYHNKFQYINSMYNQDLESRIAL